MTAAAGQAAAPPSVSEPTLEADARALADSQTTLARAPRLLAHRHKAHVIARSLERAERHLATRPLVDAALQKAAEWFLDNYYLIRRVARQVEEEVPRGFIRHLPRLASGPAEGQPRIEALARTLVARRDLPLDASVLRRFVDAYQEVRTLTIAELWALPTVLRAAVLENLVGSIDGLEIPGQTRTLHRPVLHASSDANDSNSQSGERWVASPAAGVERAIRALRVLDTLDWKGFFESASRVEAILRTDPSGIYSLMDFETCDAYRKVVESLAWSSKTDEETVANCAIALASHSPDDERLGHVGYYLVAEGRASLESHVGYRAEGIERVRRWVKASPTLSYLAPLALITGLLVLAIGTLAAHLAGRGAPVLGDVRTLASVGVAALLSVVPASALAVAVLQVAFARLLPPRTLPKLDFTKALPADACTLVVIPTLLGRDADVVSMLRQIELHYLSNPDPQLQFALLTDDVDVTALHERDPSAALLESACRQIEALNAKHGHAGIGPFHLLHRTLPWNAGEQRFMGWERKRGKLDELNRLLRGDATTSYCRHVGAPSGLVDIRFVITLDSDTELPIGAANRLVAVLAHPLNRAVLDPETGRVLSGYTIVQPRVETSPSSERQTIFSKLFAGDVGFDIYTHACSELYQDLFGAGIYVGKGIYDVDAFARSLHGCVPENALVSHDLFEGIHGRAALATDIVLFESYPASYVTYALRMHRWVRGDWQLLPWVFARVRSSNGATRRNKLAFIDRWKIVDNLRRSLTSPLLLVLLVVGWTWLPGTALHWTCVVLALLLGPLVPGLVAGARLRRDDLGRWALALAFLAYEAVVITDAIVRVLVRKTITGKNLLEWTSAAHTDFNLRGSSPRVVCWRTMRAGPLIAAAIAALVLLLRPSALPIAAPLLVLWASSPELARWASSPKQLRRSTVTPDERQELRLLARRTWRFFDTFVGPNDQWLPIDNYQEEPQEQTAHRTSPTNIGLMMVSTLTAYDFGYIGPSEFATRLKRAFESVARMTHYRGHLLNWYDTRNLHPLPPRYVSTVDSGNFAGCLLTLTQGCKDVAASPIVRREAWEGLRDSIGLLDEVVSSAPADACKAVRAVVLRVQAATLHARENLHESFATLHALIEATAPELDRELLALLGTCDHRHEPDFLRTLRTTIDRFHQQLQAMRREWDALLPWLALTQDAADHSIVLPTSLSLDEVATVAAALRVELTEREDERRKSGRVSDSLDASAKRLDAAFRSAETNATALVEELRDIASRADAEVRGMDFTLLYDDERKLFHIGYNATIDQVDEHHYDLLASEARLASYVAIIKRDVPEEHWYALGRPMTEVDGAPLLLSWGGTMFEYLMPCLLMQSQEGTLLARTAALAVDAQIAYGKRSGEPWGVSESAYARLDADQTYQYRSFGVPGLGFKRGMEADHVVAPYASLLALSLRPRAVLQNIRAFEAMGMLGMHGLFESVDFTPARVLDLAHPRQSFAIVRSYMAHHQGMILISLGNCLTGRTMVDRFHAATLIQTADALLNEQAPSKAPGEWPIVDGLDAAGDSKVSALPHAPAPWLAASDAGPQAFVVGNGRLSSLLTSSGGGGLRFQGLALTRFEPDATCNEDGLWIYVRDEQTRDIWRATSSEGRTTYAMHKAEFHFRSHGISTHVDVAVAASDDVEVRCVTLHNETNRQRRVSITSAGRPVLMDVKQAQTHPAFSSMFVESEYLSELDALLFVRRPQTVDEQSSVLVHRLVRQGDAVTFAGFESDRSAFYGRGSTRSHPAALMATKDGLDGRTGAVLDPVMSLMASVELEPNGSVTLAFVTAVSRSRGAAVALSRKYGTMHAVQWAFRDAAQESPRRLIRTRLDPDLVPAVQRLFSAMLFADASLRASPSARVASPPSQSGLWGRGISGDDPTVLVRVADADAPILRESLAAQRYLRSCGVRMDLVLVDEAASGYVTDGAGTLRSVLDECEASPWLNRHGGVFVVAADQVPAAEIRHLEACARVVLDTRDGTLESRLKSITTPPPKLPRFEPTLAADAEPPGDRSPVRPALLMDNGTGGFTEDGREYVIAVEPGKPTPAPWCNVLANPAFGCLVSESALGTTWSLNSGENRLTPWRNDPVFDTPSEALYLRDEETALVWSPTPLPAGRDAFTLVRHGAGYTIYERSSHGLVQELTVFVPHDATLKVVRLRVQNTLPRHRRITATYYAEWVLGSRREGQRPFIVSEFERDRACLLATCHWSAEFAGRVAFLAAKGKAHGFTADRTEFLGPRGDYARPEALERWGLSGRIDLGNDPCAALQVHLDLAPGESTETHFVLGQSETRDDAIALVERFRNVETVDAAWDGLHAFWDGVLDTVRVETPEPSMNIMLNRWLLYQTLSARVFGRTGFYQSSGAFGYRDQLQDVLALLHAAPEVARAHILEAATHQFEEGDVLHWWHPPSGRGVRTRCSDDMAWLPYVTGEYVAATGDTGILHAVVPFLSGERLKPGEHDRYAQYASSAESATLFDHCRRALERATTEGAHGLPLMGDGDWNDGMSRVGSAGRGESVWLGWFLCATMGRFASLCDLRHDVTLAATWRAREAALRARIRAVAWDGAWYVRAFHDDGSLLGSAANDVCQIDSIAQSWSVLSEARGAAQAPRSRSAVNEADRALVRENERLVLLLTPPFDGARHDPGYIRAYPPGIRENGGQYTHAATWLGFAHAALGDGERATRIFRLLNPSLQAKDAAARERYRVEPYALAGDVYSSPPWVGRGGWTWYTGAAAWMWRLGVEAILGLRKDSGGLRIDPCIPPAWKGFEAWVRLDQRTFHVVVENPEHVSHGVATMALDGVPLRSNVIGADPTAAGAHEVRVRLGTNVSLATERHA